LSSEPDDKKPKQQHGEAAAGRREQERAAADHRADADDRPLALAIEQSPTNSSETVGAT